MGNLHMGIKGLQSNKEITPDIDLEEKIKTNLFFCTTVDLRTTREGNIYSDICGSFVTTSSRGNK